jgi:glucose-6-phosphate isomerase
MREVIRDHTDPTEIVLVVVSKSGTTSETIANANVLFSLMTERFGVEAARRQTIIISDADAPLAHTALQQGMVHFAIPKKIGGRYSVFTAVGLVPLALLGVDIRRFCEGGVAGARAAAPDTGASSAAVLAAVLYEAYIADIRLHELFLWHPELETLGKWYRQLLAESLGKERGDGMKVGIMPTVALGSVDLHSLGQLVFGGPKDRVTTFVAAPSCWRDTAVLSADPTFMTDMLQEKRVGDVMQAIYSGVVATYREHGLPYLEIELESINERELGAFMAVHMASVMCLAQILTVNAFDQPDVEYYKSETRRILAAGS